MKATKTDIHEIKEVKEFPGLIEAEFLWKVQDATVTAIYTGPFIDFATWHEVMSFFQWSYDTHKSEAQVRLYVNVEQERWGAWAFPQEGGTGMTSKELGTPETPEQAAARFDHWGSEPSDDWIAFGTIHHHCSGGAFQSSVDEGDEKNQVGLHITVGNMDKPQRDLHARFYLNKTQFTPDLSYFWDIGAEIMRMVPSELLDKVARHQMSQKVVREFPAVWKTNYVEKKFTAGVVYDGGLGYTGHRGDWYPGKYTGTEDALFVRAEKAMTRIKQSLSHRDIELSPDELELIFERWKEPAIAAILRIMSDLKVDADDMIRYGIPSYEKKLGDKDAPKQLPDSTDHDGQPAWE